MPDHVYCVPDAGKSGHSLTKVLNNVKGVSARRVFQASPELKLDLHSEHLWTAAQVLTSLGAVENASIYVEQNPVKLGHSQQSHDWVHSGIRGRVLSFQ